RVELPPARTAELYRASCPGHRVHARCRRPHEILERLSTRVSAIGLDARVDQQRDRLSCLVLKLTDDQGAAAGGTAPVHVAQAVPVAELAHARDFQPRAVRSG